MEKLRPSLPLLLICLALLGVQVSYGLCPQDDAFISFRYAANLAEGHGLVFNPGERVEGYTNFLWTLIFAPVIALGLDPVPVSASLGMIFSLALLWSSWELAGRRWLVPLLVASFPGLSLEAVQGLETVAFAFLVCQALRGEKNWAVWAGLAALTRPLLERLPEGVYRALLLTQLADRIGLAPQHLETLLEPTEAARAPRGKTPSYPSDPGSERRSPLIRKAIELLLHHPASGTNLEVVKGLAQVHQPGAELLRRLLETIAENPQITTAGLLERFRDDQEGQHLGRLTGEIPLDDGDAAPRVLRDNLERIVESYRRERLRVLLAKGPNLEPGERSELEGLLREPPPSQSPPENQA